MNMSCVIYAWRNDCDTVALVLSLLLHFASRNF